MQFQLEAVMQNGTLGFGSSAHTLESAEETIVEHANSTYREPVKHYTLICGSGETRYYSPDGVYRTSHTFEWKA